MRGYVEAGWAAGLFFKPAPKPGGSAAEAEDGKFFLAEYTDDTHDEPDENDVFPYRKPNAPCPRCHKHKLGYSLANCRVICTNCSYVFPWRASSKEEAWDMHNQHHDALRDMWGNKLLYQNEKTGVYV
jgi:hypothetical protein